ncbi:MAG: hypothetical protein HYU83_02640 [Chloroflexi bacterium]|nr:hypothetical protein [Chloroflexota bacterium]
MTLFMMAMGMYSPECFCRNNLKTTQATNAQPSMMNKADAQTLAASRRTIFLSTIEVKATAGKPT